MNGLENIESTNITCINIIVKKYISIPDHSDSKIYTESYYSVEKIYEEFLKNQYHFYSNNGSSAFVSHEHLNETLNYICRNICKNRSLSAKPENFAQL